MKVIIFTDPHISDSVIPELDLIFQEIFNNKADKLIMIGDYYDRKRPSAQAILFGTKWAKRFVEKYKKVVFLRGNHDRTQDISAIDYLKYFGVKVVDDYIDEDNNFYGHFMLYESKLQYGTGKCGIKDLQQYNKVFLGHQHLFQNFNNKIYHLGSCYWVNFNEVEDKEKYIGIINEEGFKLQVLQSPIPMVDVKSVKELPNINPKTKVRCLVTSFSQFKKEINEISKWKDKFAEFKLKLDFGNTIIAKEEKIVNKGKINLQQLITQYIEKIEDKDVKSLLLNTYKENEN